MKKTHIIIVIGIGLSLFSGCVTKPNEETARIAVKFYLAGHQDGQREGSQATLNQVNQQLAQQRALEKQGQTNAPPK